MNEMIYESKYIGTLTAAVLYACGAYKTVRITPAVEPVFVKFGDSTVVASAADGNELIAPGESKTYTTSPAQTHVSVIEQAVGAKVTIALIG